MTGHTSVKHCKTAGKEDNADNCRLDLTGGCDSTVPPGTKMQKVAEDDDALLPRRRADRLPSPVLFDDTDVLPNDAPPVAEGGGKQPL